MRNIAARNMAIIRMSIPDESANITIAEDITQIIIKNAGAVDLTVNVDSETPSNYLTLKPDEFSPTLTVHGGLVMYLDGVGGSTTAEIICWG